MVTFSLCRRIHILKTRSLDKSICIINNCKQLLEKQLLFVRDIDLYESFTNKIYWFSLYTIIYDTKNCIYFVIMYIYLIFILRITDRLYSLMTSDRLIYPNALFRPMTTFILHFKRHIDKIAFNECVHQTSTPYSISISPKDLTTFNILTYYISRTTGHRF